MSDRLFMKRSLIAATLALAILAQAPKAYQVGPAPEGRSTYIVVLHDPSVAERVVGENPRGAIRQSRRVWRDATPLHQRAVAASQKRFLNSLDKTRAAHLERDFLSDAARRIDDVIDRLARRNSRWFVRMFYELMFAISTSDTRLLTIPIFLIRCQRRLRMTSQSCR